MTTVVEIPLVAATPRNFRVVLAGSTYAMHVYWCVPAQCWVLDIADQDSVPLVNGLAMVTGTDLLVQYGYLDITVQLLVVSDQKPPDVVPGWNDWGSGGTSTGHLYAVLD